ncbi:MAG: transketolase family protein [Nitrospirales bacterium]
MRKTCLDTVYDLAKEDPRIFFIGSDLGNGTLNEFRQEMPERFFMEGVSEANIIGIATGLALEGKIPYVNTIATFLTRRCFEQLAVDVCLHDANVRLLGSGGGLVYAPLGPTHLAIDDIAILRALPRMTIVAPADASEMRQLICASRDYSGPIYIRMAKGGDPILTEQNEPFQIGPVFQMKEGRDALIVTTGVTLNIALQAATQLEDEGINAAVVHVPTVKPLDAETLIGLMDSVPAIVTIEEHSIIGGLGSAIAEVIAETDFRQRKCFKRIGIPDEFPDRYGSQADLLGHYGIHVQHLSTTVRAIVNHSKPVAVAV